MKNTLIAFMIGTINVLAQNVYTPNGTLIDPNSYFTYSTSNSQNQSLQNDIQNGTYGSSCVIVGSYSNNYNCHGYAWNVYDGGRQVALDAVHYSSVDTYINDNSYKSTTNTILPRVRIRYTGDHSAVMSYIANRYVSKWGSGPLVRHAPGDVYPSYGSPYAYYQCNFTSQITSMYLDNSQYYSGPTVPATVGSHSLAFNATYAPTYSYSVLDAGLTINSQSGNVVNFTKSSSGSKRFYVTPDIGCVSTANQTIIVIDPSGGGRIIAYPNPANDQLTVEYIFDRSAIENDVQVKRIKEIILTDNNSQIIGRQTIINQNQNRSSGNVTFGSIPTGHYFIKILYTDGTLETKRILAGGN